VFQAPIGRSFKVIATLQNHLRADRSSFCWFYEKPTTINFFKFQKTTFYSKEAKFDMFKKIELYAFAIL